MGNRIRTESMKGRLRSAARHLKFVSRSWLPFRSASVSWWDQLQCFTVAWNEGKKEREESGMHGKCKTFTFFFF